MAPNAQVAGQALIVEGMADATAQVGGMALIVEASADATAQVAAVALIVETVPQTSVIGPLAMYHYRRRRT